MQIPTRTGILQLANAETSLAAAMYFPDAQTMRLHVQNRGTEKLMKEYTASEKSESLQFSDDCQDVYEEAARAEWQRLILRRQVKGSMAVSYSYNVLFVKHVP